MIPYFGRDAIRVLYTDTDSFIWVIYTEDLYKDLEHFKTEFDFSKYCENHALHNTENRSIPGKWKDELNGEIIEEGVFLRSKSYSIKCASDTISTLAGVKKSSQNFLCHTDYINVLKNTDVIIVNQKRFGSKDHKVFTYSENKRALIPFDDKRYQCNSVLTLPYGHYLLNLKDR